MLSTMKNILNNLGISTLLIIGLIALNIFSLYFNLKRQHEVNQLAQRLEELESEIVWGGVDVFAKITHPDIYLTSEGLTLVVLFTDKSCPSCLLYEVSYLNDFYSQHGAFVQVYYVSHEQPDLANYGADFPFNHISPNQSLLDTDFDLSNTVAILVDSQGVVQQVYRAEVGNQNKCRLFYQRMASLMGGQ